MTVQAAAARRRSILAAVLGNFVEFYDWTVYAYMAPLFAAQIFVARSPAVSLLLAFSTFALGYMTRPLGALLFGLYADRIGRRKAMSASILTMAAGSLLIGCTPTYARIGVVAPILVLLTRVIQGFAAGGEGGSANAYLTELAEPMKRAATASLQQVSTGISTLVALGLSAILTTILSAAQMQSYGWRLPFLVGAGLGFVGLYLRRHAAETQIFLVQPAPDRVPTLIVLVRNWRALVLTIGICLLPSTVFFSWQIYFPTYVTATTHLARSAALWVSAGGLVCFVLFIPPFAMLSDRYGRRPMLIGYTLAAMVWAYPTYIGLPTFASSLAGALVVALVGNLILAAMAGSLIAAMTEIFATAVRATGNGVAYAVSIVISGASYPPLVTALLAGKHYWLILAYVDVIAIISLAAYIVMPETQRRRIED